jgi:Ca-activated chloride channel family protein
VLDALFPGQGIDVGEMTFGGKPRGRSLDDKDKPPPLQSAPVAPGSYNAAAIMLLSDGRRTTGVDTREAAKMATNHGARIYVVGLGSEGDSGAMPEGMTHTREVSIQKAISGLKFFARFLNHLGCLGANTN